MINNPTGIRQGSVTSLNSCFVVVGWLFQDSDLGREDSDSQSGDLDMDGISVSGSETTEPSTPRVGIKAIWWQFPYIRGPGYSGSSE